MLHGPPLPTDEASHPGAPSQSVGPASMSPRAVGEVGPWEGAGCSRRRDEMASGMPAGLKGRDAEAAAARVPVASDP